MNINSNVRVSGTYFFDPRELLFRLRYPPKKRMQDKYEVRVKSFDANNFYDINSQRVIAMHRKWDRGMSLIFSVIMYQI